MPPQLIDAARGRFFSLPDGKRLRYAVFDPPGKAHGTVFVAPGRREFIEKKYAEVGADFIARGFRVIFFEWRGQGLSSRFFEGERRQRDHVVDFTVHIDDLNLFYDQIVAPNLVGKLILHGHSMGAHLLLRWLSERVNAGIAGVFLTAPMLAIAGGLAQASASFVSWSAARFGYGEDYVHLQHDYNDEDRAFAGNPLSHDPDRFAIIEQYFSAHPDLTVGGVTWDWIHAAMKSMYLVQRRVRLESIDVPVLAILGNDDLVTPPDESIRFLKMIPKAETILMPGARHDIMNEITPCRDEAWRQIDGFLKRVI